MTLKLHHGSAPLYTGPVWGPMAPSTCAAYWHGLLSLGITSVTTTDGTIAVLDRINILEGSYG